MPRRRLQPVLDLLAGLNEPPGSGRFELVASGRSNALDSLTWPASTVLLPHAGWQRADAALAEAYRPSRLPLILVSGDGDFALLAARHPGPVLVISGSPSGRLRDRATVVDPATEGVEPIRRWLAAVGAVPDRSSES